MLTAGKLGAFDRKGLHASSWDAMRRAAHMRDFEDRCSWPGCDATRLTRSHTLARSLALAPITIDGHVLMPSLGDRLGSMERIGWKNATTFPGFCDPHEQRFGVFESSKRITAPEHVALQLFRSSSREYWNKRRRYAYLDTLQREFSGVFFAKAAPGTPETLADDVLSPLESLMARMHVEAQQLAAIWRLCWTLGGIEGESGVAANPTAIRRLTIPTTRRIALSGSTFLQVSGGEEDGIDRVPVVLAMIPSPGALDCMFVTPPSVAGQYESMISEQVASGNADEFVDRWLTATEWWCADQRWWEEQTDSAWRAKILHELAQP
ncbi:hypothetical protein BIU89_12310 [Curtobacterium sp. MCBA15_005]|nr:hypothetical protein BIU89_12310 [Curtobacterium sp. MCBA15_005]